MMMNLLRHSLLIACFVTLGCAQEKSMNSASSPLAEVQMYSVYEVSLASAETFDNPFRDAACWAVFTSPAGRQIRVEGFYYGQTEWRVRFVPREHGQWKWTARLDGGKKPVAASGGFACSGAAGHGYLRISSKNKFRFEHEDGTAFYPVGIQTCNFLQPDFDGPPASEGQWRNVNNEEWLKEFSGTVNLVRTQFGQGRLDGCSLALIPAPPKPPKGASKPATASAPAIPADRYDLELARKIDEAYRLHRQAGIAQILILYQDMSLWGDGPCAFGMSHDLKDYKSVHAANMPLQEQYIRYIIARWGCYVDIWEIFNEDSYAPDDYLAHLAGVIRKADPYGHLLTTNYARPGAAWSDLNTWHEYMGMPANEVDEYVTSQVALLKSHGKLVQNTEFGNQGKLSNVDPVKWRIAVWSAFMQESGLLFWGMSGRQVEKVDRGNANAYIGPDSRQHFRVFHKLTHDLPVDVRPVFTGYTGHTDIRSYALCNGRQGIIYVHHFKDHAKPFPSSQLMVQTGPGRWSVKWFDASDGKVLSEAEQATDQQYLSLRVPEVTIDVVGRLERVGEPATRQGQ